MVGLCRESQIIVGGAWVVHILLNISTYRIIMGSALQHAVAILAQAIASTSLSILKEWPHGMLLSHLDAIIVEWLITRTTRLTSSSCSLLYLRDPFLGRTVEPARGPHLRGQHLYRDACVFGSLATSEPHSVRSVSMWQSVAQTVSQTL